MAIGMTFDEIKTAVASRLPDYYEPLATTFFGRDTRQQGSYVVFGNDTGSDLCVDIADGCVYAVSATCKVPKRFVNSGLGQFLRFFDEYRAVADKIYSGKNVRADDLARALADRLQAIDPAALGDPYKWWEPALEQLTEG